MNFDMIHFVLFHEDPSPVVYQKLLSKLIAERDWSAQECCHLLLGCPLYQTTQQFRSLNLSYPRFNAFRELDSLMDNDDLASMDMNWIDHYEQWGISAHPEFAHVSLLQVFRRYDWRAGKFVLRPRAKPRVVNIWPVYK